MKKPLSAIELAVAAIGLIKTASLVTAMMVLEWARLRERRAKLEAAGAAADLAVAKAELEASKDDRADSQVVDDYLRSRGIPPGNRQG